MEITLTPWQQTRIYHITRELQITTGGDTRKYRHSCDMELKYIAREKDNHIISIFRKNYEMENKPPHLLAAKVTGMLQRGLYPIECVLDASGNWIGINNMQEIRRNWEQRVARVQREYKGEAVESIVKIMENHLADEARLLETLQKDLVHSGLFAPLYRVYQTKEKNEEEMQVPVLGIGFIQARGYFQFGKEPEEQTKIWFKSRPAVNTSQAEVSKDYFHKQGIEFNSERFTGDVEFLTEIDNDPFTFREINLNLSHSDQWEYQERVQYQFKGLSVI